MLIDIPNIHQNITIIEKSLQLPYYYPTIIHDSNINCNPLYLSFFVTSPTRSVRKTGFIYPQNEKAELYLYSKAAVC